MRRNEKLSGRVIVEPKKNNKEEKSLDTERERVRKKAKRRTIVSWIFVIGLSIGFCVLCGIFVQNLIEIAQNEKIAVSEENSEREPKAKIIDENNAEAISGRTKEYIWQLEGDLKDLGYEVERVVLPVGKMREVDINLSGIAPYFKVNLERETAVSAEDIVRMIKYLEGNGLIGGVGYVDVRISGKAFYK